MEDRDRDYKIALRRIGCEEVNGTYSGPYLTAVYDISYVETVDSAVTMTVQFNLCN